MIYLWKHKNRIQFGTPQSIACRLSLKIKKVRLQHIKKNVMHMKLKDVAVVGVLLATGAILRYFLTMLNTPLTPNMIIAFYCLAIISIKPKIFEALGIGIVAGFLSMVISEFHLPPANLISELVGAYVCYIFYDLLRQRQNLAPLVTTFVATLASGFTFAGLPQFLQARQYSPCITAISMSLLQYMFPSWLSPRSLMRLLFRYSASL